MHISVPAGPLMPGRIWLRVDLWGNRLQHDHDAVALDDSPKVFIILAVSAASVSDVKS